MSTSGVSAGMVLQATTGLAGFALQNGTPVILSWTPPNDGLLHRYLIMATQVVTVAETGGQVNVNFSDPGGTARTRLIFVGGAAAGFQTIAAADAFRVVQGGTAVQVVQQSALTAGAAMLWAEIWGS